MSSFTKVVLTVVGSVVLACGVGLAFLVHLALSFGSNLCSDTVNGSIKAPNKKFTVYVIERDCGATAGASAISVYPSGTQPPKNDLGNVYRCEDNYPVDVQWKGSKKLIVHCSPSAEAFKQVSNIDGITVDYIHDEF